MFPKVDVVVIYAAYMLMAPVLSVPHMVPNGFAKPFVYVLTALWSLCPVPLTSMMFTGMFPIIASP